MFQTRKYRPDICSKDVLKNIQEQSTTTEVQVPDTEQVFEDCGGVLHIFECTTLPKTVVQ